MRETYSVFLRKSARNCPPYKSSETSKICQTDKPRSPTESGQFVKDFSTKQSRIFFIFAIATNDRGYGHGRFAGVFAVAQRQGECGRKTC